MKSIFLFLFSVVIVVNLFAQSSISGFSPGAGAIGSTVTITGTNFNTTAAQNIVFFGATQSIVTAATGSSLTVTVPLGATYQYISVTNLASRLTAYSAKPFNVTYLSGSINFIPKADFATGVNPYSVNIGDIDGDGKPDLVVANSIDNTVSVLRNNSMTPFVSFEPKVTFITGKNPYSVSIGDIDGDGKPDLAVVNKNSATVSILRNTSTLGAIKFEVKMDFATGAKPNFVSIGDIDGDGKSDLVVTNNGSSTVSILRNTSTPAVISFAVKLDLPTGSKPVSVCIGDIDGDGKPDLAVANNGSNTVSVLRNTTASGLVNFAVKVDLPTGTKPYSVSIGDIDRDGKPDLVVANFNANTVSVLRNLSTTGFIIFDLKVDVPTGSGPASVSIGDIDGDGKSDLAVANFNDSTVSVLRNVSTSGMISFAAKVNYATGSYPVSVSIGDLNGDGQPDLSVANDSSNSVSVILQPCIVPTINSAGISGQTQIIGKTFMPITVMATGSLITYQWYQNISYSNSGGTSLATANGAQTNSYTPQATVVGSLYYYCVVSGICGMPQTTAVSGAFIVTPPLPPTISSFTPGSGAIGSSVTITGTNFNTAAAQNIVFFGATQAMVTAATANNLTVTVPLGATYQYISVTNLAASLTAYSAMPFNVTLPGSINFTGNMDFATGSGPVAIAIGDMDADGKPDLVVTNNSSKTISVLLNTSTAGLVSFAAKMDFATGNYPFSATIADIDGDGKPDIAVVNMSDSSVSVFRNTSTAGLLSFEGRVNFATGYFSYKLDIGDLDGDGKPDISVINLIDSTVSVLRNTSTAGLINFESRIVFRTGEYPLSITIGDIDADGKPDLAVTNSSTATVCVLRNTSTKGTISFAGKVNFTTGIGPTSVSIGDIDGDGKLDLAVANQNSGTISVLLNTSASGVVTFAPKVDFLTGANPYSVTIGDLDGDGKPDLAVARLPNYNGNPPGGISVLRNTSIAGALNFATYTSYTTGAYPFSITIGDIDGDGKPDLVAPNPTIKTISVLLQLAPPLARIAALYAIRNNIVAAPEKSGFTINPNPVVSSTISVQLKNQPAGKYILRFVNTIGQPVFTGILQHSGGNSTQTVNLPAGIAKGTYQAELHSVNGIFSTQTIIINTKK